MHVGRGCDHRLRRRGQLDRQGVRRRRPRGPLRRHRRRPGRGPAGPGLRGDDHRRPARPALVRLPDPADPQPGAPLRPVGVRGRHQGGRPGPGRGQRVPHRGGPLHRAPGDLRAGRPAAARAGLGQARQPGVRAGLQPRVPPGGHGPRGLPVPLDDRDRGPQPLDRRPALQPHPELRGRGPRLRQPTSPAPSAGRPRPPPTPTTASAAAPRTAGPACPRTPRASSGWPSGSACPCHCCPPSSR